MEFVENGDLPALEPLDHIALPQRPRSIQQRHVEMAHHLHQLLSGARSGQGDRSDVIVEIDVVDRHPVGKPAGPEGGTAVERSDGRRRAERVDDAAGEVRPGFPLGRIEQHQHAGVRRPRR